jgi:hypothetical protein
MLVDLTDFGFSFTFRLPSRTIAFIYTHRSSRLAEHGPGWLGRFVEQTMAEIRWASPTLAASPACLKGAQDQRIRLLGSLTNGLLRCWHAITGVRILRYLSTSMLLELYCGSPAPTKHSTTLSMYLYYSTQDPRSPSLPRRQLSRPT